MNRPLLAALLALTLTACQKDLVCPQGRAVCGGACVDVTANPAHCGACGNACGGGTPFCAPTAAGSSCVAACPIGLTPCGHGCITGSCQADLLAACGATSEVLALDAELLQAGESRTVTAGLTVLTVTGTTVVSGSGYPVAGLDFLPADPLAGAAPVHLDLVGSSDVEGLAIHDGLVFAADATSGTVAVVTPGGTLLDQIPLPDQQRFPNPHGLAFVGERGYVALYGGGPTSGQAVAVLELSGLAACARPGAAACGAGGACAAGFHCVEGTCRPACGAVQSVITLAGAPGATDAGGVPFPSKAVAVGTRVFVTLSNLKLADTGFGAAYVEPAGPGKLAIIDTAAGDALSILDLGAACGNPDGLALQGTTLWVACGSFSFPTAWPGTMVPVAVAGAPVVGAPLDVSAVVPNGVALCGGRGYVPDQASGKVLRFDPVARIVSPTVDVCPVRGFAYVADLACAP